MVLPSFLSSPPMKKQFIYATLSLPTKGENCRHLIPDGHSGYPVNLNDSPLNDSFTMPLEVFKIG